MPNSQQDVIAFLSDPRSYRLNGGKVERHETHGAIVFLAGDYAWKLKRAVRYPYMDYSTLEARRAMCRRELAVNRRTAPELYIAVRPIVRNIDGQLCFGSEHGAGEVREWVVVMRRFQQSDLLANIMRHGELIRNLAEAIAGFHRTAEPAPEFGGADGIQAVVDENANLLRELCPQGQRAQVDRLDALVATAIARSAPLLEHRRNAGKVRRCHGDLHLNNICMIAGRPVLFDAIEFNDNFACVDVFYDLAFLLMDLMRHGDEPCANALLNHYLELTGDYEGLVVLPLLIACRAGISAHVAISRGRETGKPDDIGKSREQFRELVDLGIACLDRPGARLVAIGGVSGTGKSTLAVCLAPELLPAPGAIVLRSDVLRKEIMNVPETERLPESAYTDAMHRRVYALLGTRATSILAAGYSVIIDAVFGDDCEHSAIERMGREVGVPFTGLWLDGAPAMLEQRVAARLGDASDATVEVLCRQLAHVTRPAGWAKIGVGSPADEPLAGARKALAKDMR
jgi:hypothetical protein